MLWIRFPSKVNRAGYRRAHGIGFAMAAALSPVDAAIAFNSSNEDSLKKGLNDYRQAGIYASGYVCG